MENAIKFFLKKRNMQQKYLTKEKAPKISKQNISKYIHRERRIPEFAQNYISKELNVPKDFFVDDDGYCRELNEIEIKEYEEYLKRQPFAFDEYSTFYNQSLRIPEREYYFKRRVTSILNRIRKDMRNTTRCNKVLSFDALIDSMEYHLSIYEKIVDLQEKNLISDDEWLAVLRGLSYVVDDISLEKIEADSSLADDMYFLLKKYREKKKIQNAQNIQKYTEILGELPILE